MDWVHWILARACTQEGDYAGAREWLAQIPEGQYEEMRTWLLADVFWAQGHVARAKREYGETLRLARATSSEEPERAALCGLAAIALAGGNLTDAERYTAELLRGLEAHPWPYGFLGFNRHLVCYRVLRANGDPRADAILDQAYRMLEQRAAQIEDEVLRRSYLENVPANRELIAAFEQR